MSQVTGNLTINDGSATPVAKTFAPLEVAPSSSVFAEKSAGISAGYTLLTVTFDRARANRKTNKIGISLALPIVGIVNGVSTVTDTGRFSGTFTVPDNFTAQNRADLHAFVANALNNALLKGVVKDLDPLY